METLLSDTEIWVRDFLRYGGMVLIVAPLAISMAVLFVKAVLSLVLFPSSSRKGR